MHLRIALCVLLPMAAFAQATAQIGVTVAPGEIFVLPLPGVIPVLSTDTPYTPDESKGPWAGWNTRLSGITIDLKQGSQSYSLGLRYLQTPKTAVTVFVPYGFDPKSADPATLSVRVAGAEVLQIPVTPATDAVHILNSCDNAGTFLSIIAGSAPTSACLPILMNSSGLIRPDTNPARPGDTVSMWANGLGAQGETDSMGLLSVVNTFRLNFLYVVNAGPVRADYGPGITGVPLYIGGGASGLYQINFTLPPVPGMGLAMPPCTGTDVKSNLTITLSGPASFDAARICIQ